MTAFFNCNHGKFMPHRSPTALVAPSGTSHMAANCGKIVRAQLIGRRSNCGSLNVGAFTMLIGTTCTERCEADHAQP
jgi:hypothetical protein